MAYINLKEEIKKEEVKRTIKNGLNKYKRVALFNCNVLACEMQSYYKNDYIIEILYCKNGIAHAYINKIKVNFDSISMYEEIENCDALA